MDCRFVSEKKSCFNKNGGQYISDIGFGKYLLKQKNNTKKNDKLDYFKVKYFCLLKHNKNPKYEKIF